MRPAPRWPSAPAACSSSTTDARAPRTRAAGSLSGRLTASLGHCVSVHGVLVETAERPVRADQPNGVTVVTEVVLGAWLESHPRAFDDREVRMLASTLRPTGVATGTR